MNAEMQNEVFLGENVGSYESYPKPLTTDEYYLEKMYSLIKTMPTTSYSAAVPSSGGSGGADGLMSATDKEKLDGVQAGAQANVQADWAQDDSTADDYILHKPDISQLPKFSIKVVSDLPVSDISYTTIYLVPITNSASPDIYTEYIRVKGENGASDAWEALGTQTVDLSDYVTTTAMNTALNAKQDALTAGANVSIATVNGVLTVSATDTTYSDATQQAHGLMSTADKTKLDGIQTGATTVSVTQTLASGTKIGTVTVNGTDTDLYCETNTDTTYSAGTGLSLSGTTFSNSAPNVKSDWNAAAGTDAEILNKPTIPNYSNATPSASGVGGSAGLMSATDKEKLDKMVVISSAGYAALDPPDSNTLYFVLEVSS